MYSRQSSIVCKRLGNWDTDVEAVGITTDTADATDSPMGVVNAVAPGALPYSPLVPLGAFHLGFAPKYPRIVVAEPRSLESLEGVISVPH